MGGVGQWGIKKREKKEEEAHTEDTGDTEEEGGEKRKNFSPRR